MLTVTERFKKERNSKEKRTNAKVRIKSRQFRSRATDMIRTNASFPKELAVPRATVRHLHTKTIKGKF
jgi:hypothetical protein